MISPVLRILSRPAGRQLVRRYGGGEGYTPASMNDLPVPNGSWQQNYNAKQKINNTWLMVGVTSFVASFYAAYQSGLVVLLWSPDFKKMSLK